MNILMDILQISDQINIYSISINKYVINKQLNL